MSDRKQEVGHSRHGASSTCPTQSAPYAMGRTQFCAANPDARTLVPRDRAARPEYRELPGVPRTRGDSPCPCLKSFSLAILVMLLLAPCAFAGPNREVTDANALYATGQFQEALDIYARLAEQQPENAELQFNQGAAQFQLGNMDDAKSAFQAAGQQSDNPSLQALSAYNLGNCALQTAQEEAGEDPEKAIKTLFQGVRHFKDALSRDKNLEEAANNLELARHGIRQLREQVKEQQKQQQEQQQKKDEAKEKLDELIEEQEQNNQQSQEASEQQQDPAQSDPSQQEMNDQADQQQSTREDTEELAKSMDDPQDNPAPSPMDEAKDHAEKAAEKQQEAEENLRNEEPKKANEAQEEALDELKQARESLEQDEESDGDKSKGDPSDEDGEKDDEEQPSDPQDEGEDKQDEQDSSEEEGEAEDMKEVPPPDATARDILNQEKQNKEERNLRRMMRFRPVEKDW
jgi:hypothetical protein